MEDVLLVLLLLLYQRDVYQYDWSTRREASALEPALTDIQWLAYLYD